MCKIVKYAGMEFILGGRWVSDVEMDQDPELVFSVYVSICDCDLKMRAPSCVLISECVLTLEDSMKYRGSLGNKEN